MTTIWRCAWREQQDAAPPKSDGGWFDSEEEALARADEVVRTRRVVGEVLVYDVKVYGAGAA